MWTINAQKGVPALKYLMKNHYSLMLSYVLAMLYSEQSRGSFDIARIYFDVITSLDIPDELLDDNNDKDDSLINLLKQLIVFCLMYSVPFIPSELIKSAENVSLGLHERDINSIITFRGIPSDNFGSNYSVSLPSAMDPSIVHNIQNNHKQLIIGCYNRPRLLSPQCVSSMGISTSYLDKINANKNGKIIVELVDDIMQSIDMSRKTFKLFYKIILIIGNKYSQNIPTLDKLHELRMSLQSNDLRDVRQNSLSISWVFANICPTDLAIIITNEILSVLEIYAEKIEYLEERGQLLNASNKLHNQITLISNFLQVSLPWFAAAPLLIWTSSHN